MTIQGAGGEEWQTFEYKQADGDPEAWRGLADGTGAAIEKLRKRDALWRLVRRDGKPLAREKVEVLQTGSAFTWGFNSWGWMNQMANGEWDHMPNVHRRKLWLELFNSIILLHYWAETTPDDAPVSEEYQGEIDYDKLDRMLTWCKGHNLYCKGHPLFWQVPKALPKWLMKYDLETRWRFVEVRIRQITSRFKGRIGSYDVSNEMMWEPVLAHTHERHWPHIEEIETIADDHARLLGWAREEDPDAVYLLNEYGLLAGDREPMPVKDQHGREVTRHQQLERYMALIHAMIERDQAPDALGLQTTPGEWSGLGAFLKTIDAMGSTGLPVHVTEFRPNTRALGQSGLDEEAQEQLLADYVETTCRACFANPHVEAFYFWDTHCLANGRKPTETYRRIHDLIRNQWMTRIETETDADGYLNFRGFLGKYSVRVPRAQGSTGYAAELKQGDDASELSVYARRP
ncbi:MAG: endo-1,4-beta-xylanase [Oceanipulchritudo sp.]